LSTGDRYEKPAGTVAIAILAQGRSGSECCLTPTGFGFEKLVIELLALPAVFPEWLRK
jgi:hypothetical protein